MEQLLSVIWKSLVIFILLVTLSRLIGRKILSQMNFADFTVAITIGTISGSFVVSSTKGYWVLGSVIMLCLLAIATSFLSVKSLAARKLIEGEPVVIIKNGKILKRNMAKTRYNLDDLEMQLREKKIFDFSQVEFALLEPNGTLSVKTKSQFTPVTPHDLHLSSKYEGLATEIVKDGDVLEQNLRQNNLNFKWLYNELSRHGVEKIEDVFYAALNTDGTLYLDIKNDSLKYKQTVEDC